MHRTEKVRNEYFTQFCSVLFCALISNWRAKVEKLFDAPLEPPSPLIISELNIAYYLLRGTHMKDIDFDENPTSHF